MASVDAAEGYVVRCSPGSLVAGGASGSVVRDLPPRVCKRRGGPVRSGVAGRARAGRREAVAGVIRDCSSKRRSAVPIGSVATVAIGRRHGGTGVAEVAGHGGVRTGQREAGGAVIECGAQPRSGRMAGRAGRWISGSDVIGHRAAKRRRAVPVGGVAAVAIGGQRAAVVAVRVAQRASHGGVGASQRESSRAVIER